MNQEIIFNNIIQILDLENYIHIDSINPGDFLRQIEMEMSKEYNLNNPEDLLIDFDLEKEKQKMFNSLSSEAKEIISIITDCPSNLIEICFAGNKDKVVIKRLKKLMRKQWRDGAIVNKLFREVTKYALMIKQLNSL